VRGGGTPVSWIMDATSNQEQAGGSGAGGKSGAGGARETSRRLIHKGRKFSFEMVTVRKASGKVLEREVVRHPGAVVIVPVLENGDLVLIRNQRIAIGARLLEFPAGTLEAGEDPAACAGRELIEETGYEAAKITPLGWFYTTPGLTDEKMYAFVAEGLKEVGQALEEDEDIVVERIPAAAALKALDEGEFHDAKSIVALVRAERLGKLGSGKTR